MNALVRLFFFLFCCFGLSAQDLKGLREQMRAANDSVMIFAHYSYGEVFELSNPDSAAIYYDKALLLSRQKNFKRGIATYAGYKIVLLNNQGKYKEALDLCNEALQIFEELNSKTDIGIVKINIGSEWEYLGDLNLAAENYLQAKKILESDRHVQNLRIINNNLASVYLKTGNIKKSEAFAREGLRLAYELGKDYPIASSLLNLAEVYTYKKQFQQATELYDKVKAIGTKNEDYILEMDAFIGISDVYAQQFKFDAALENIGKALEIARAKSIPEYELYGYKTLGFILFKQKKYQASAAAFETSLQYALDTDNKNEQFDILKMAMEVEKLLNNSAKIVYYNTLFLKITDELAVEKREASIQLAEAKYEFEKNNKLIKALKAEKELQQLKIEQKNKQNIGLLILLLFLLLIGYFFYRTINQKKIIAQKTAEALQQEKQVQTAQALIKGEETERTRLARDLHDGLGGMLSGIKYQLNSMKGNIILSEEYADVFGKSLFQLDNAISEMRRVAHNMMPEALLKFGLNDALADYCNAIAAASDLKIIYQSIGLHERLEQSVEIALYRIVQELLNNIVKHADATEVQVQLTMHGSKITLTVEDNGKGFVLAESMPANGFGLSSLKNRVNYLNGKMDIRSDASGTSVLVELEIK